MCGQSTCQHAWSSAARMPRFPPCSKLQYCCSLGYGAEVHMHAGSGNQPGEAHSMCLQFGCLATIHTCPPMRNTPFVCCCPTVVHEDGTACAVTYRCVSRLLQHNSMPTTMPTCCKCAATAQQLYSQAGATWRSLAAVQDFTWRPWPGGGWAARYSAAVCSPPPNLFKHTHAL
jgi:hypothetical protein